MTTKITVFQKHDSSSAIYTIVYYFQEKTKAKQKILILNTLINVFEYMNHLYHWEVWFNLVNLYFI